MSHIQEMEAQSRLVAAVEAVGANLDLFREYENHIITGHLVFTRQETKDRKERAWQDAQTALTALRAAVEERGRF